MTKSVIICTLIITILAACTPVDSETQAVLDYQVQATQEIRATRTPRATDTLPPVPTRNYELDATATALSYAMTDVAVQEQAIRVALTQGDATIQAAYPTQTSEALRLEAQSYLAATMTAYPVQATATAYAVQDEEIRRNWQNIWVEIKTIGLCLTWFVVLVIIWTVVSRWLNRQKQEDEFEDAVEEIDETPVPRVIQINQTEGYGARQIDDPLEQEEYDTIKSALERKIPLVFRSMTPKENGFTRDEWVSVRFRLMAAKFAESNGGDELVLTGLGRQYFRVT